MTLPDAAEAGGVFLSPAVNNAFKRRSHARCACDLLIFSFLLRDAMSYRRINTIHC
jgi:hypothetical protein